MQRHLYRTRLTLAVLALGGMLPALGAAPATALPPVLGPGGLDPSFGTGGKVLTGFGGDSALAFAAALQPDGRIVVAGKTFSANGKQDFALARYNGNGSLDTAFGTGGKVLTDFSGSASAAALQPDGRIVAAGGGALARYNANGSMHATFGTGGNVLIGYYLTLANALAVQPDGQIVAAGVLSSGSQWELYFALWRYQGR